MKRNSFIIKTQNSFFLSKTYLYYAIIIVILLKPAIIEDILFLDTLFNAFRVIVSICYIIKMVLFNKKIKKDWMIIASLFLIVLFSTIISHGNISKPIAHFLPGMGLIAFILADKNATYNKISAIVNTGIILLVLNFLTVVLYPEGLVYRVTNPELKIWILGQKQELGGFLIPLIFCGLALNYFDAYWRKKVICIVCLGVLTLILEQPIGALVCVILFVLLLFMDKYIIKTNKSLLIIGIIMIFIGFQYICFNFDDLYYIQNALGKINTRGLSKVRTLNIRFSMWQFAWQCIFNHPLIGIGNLSVKEWIRLSNLQYISVLDNLYLDILFTGGLFSFALFIWLIKRCFNTFIRLWNERKIRYMGYCIFVLCVLFMEGSQYVPLVFLVLSVNCWFRNLYNQANDMTGVLRK